MAQNASKIVLTLQPIQGIIVKLNSEKFMKKLFIIILLYSSSAYSQYSERDKICMAKAIYWEARGEIYIGKLAVASVILNRLKDPQFPNSVCSVVYERKGSLTQFSPHLTRSSRIVDKKSFNTIVEISDKVLKEQEGLHRSFHALYFHSKRIRPNWVQKEVVGIVGNHIFYY